MLYVRYYEKLSTKVPYVERIWRLRVKDCIEYYLQVFKFEKLSLSLQQWEAISKTNEINDTLIQSQTSIEDNETFDDSTINNENLNELKKNSQAIVTVNKSSAKLVEINIVGPNDDVDRFIVKIKVI